MLLTGKFVNVCFFFFFFCFFFFIPQINQTLLSNGKHRLNHNSVPFVKEGLVLFNHLQFNCIAWDSIRNVSMNLTFNYRTGPTRFFGCKHHSRSQGVTIHKTKITCIRPINIITESIVICWDQK